MKCRRKIVASLLSLASVTLVNAQGVDEVAPVAVEQVSDALLVNMNFDDTDIKTVLEIVGGLRPEVSLIIDEDVVGNVTVNLKDVEWSKAMELILTPRGYSLIDEGNNIYRVALAQADDGNSVNVVQSDVGIEDPLFSIQLMTEKELAEIDVKTAKKMLGYNDKTGPITEEELRKQLLDSPFPFVKYIKVVDQPVVDVLSRLADEANLDYTISTKLPEVAVVPGEEAIAQPAYTIPNVSLTIKNKSMKDVLYILADDGEYLCTESNGMWRFEPMPPSELEPLDIQTFEIKYVKVNDQLVGPLRKTLTKRGSIEVLGKKILLVKDTKESLAQITRVLETLDKPIPQVLVEIRFFEVNDGEDSEIGLNWEKMLGNDGLQFHTGAYAMDKNGKTNQVIDAPLPFLDDDGDEIFVPVNSAVLSMERLDPVLKALDTFEYATQLSNPKVIVASEEQATVHIGDQEPIVQTEISDGDNAKTTVKLDTNFGGESATNVNLLEDKEAKTVNRKGYSGYLDTGTLIIVAPSVKSEEDVYVKIVPELISITGYLSPIGGISFPKLSKTTVYTEFMLKTGQTAAIGGLVKEDLNDVEHSVPVLGDIPYLGRVFKYNSKEKQRKEVLIFVTVNILGAEQIKETAGVPVESTLSDDMLKRIREADAKGSQFTLDESAVDAAGSDKTEK